MLVSLANERLTQKQKKIVLALEKNEHKVNVTRVVPLLAEMLSCSHSTIWNNLRSLKKSGLVSYGSVHENGKVVELTRFGKIVVEELEKMEEKI